MESELLTQINPLATGSWFIECASLSSIKIGATTSKTLLAKSWDVPYTQNYERPLYPHFYKDCDAVLWVVDASGRDRYRQESIVEECKRVVHEVPLVRKKPVPLLLYAQGTL